MASTFLILAIPHPFLIFPSPSSFFHHSARYIFNPLPLLNHDPSYIFPLNTNATFLSHPPGYFPISLTSLTRHSPSSHHCGQTWAARVCSLLLVGGPGPTPPHSPWPPQCSRPALARCPGRCWREWCAMTAPPSLLHQEGWPAEQRGWWRLVFNRTG